MRSTAVQDGIYDESGLLVGLSPAIDSLLVPDIHPRGAQPDCSPVDVEQT